MTVADEKAGFSTNCRNARHDMCARLRARCTCTCHGPGGQMPPDTAPKNVTPIKATKHRTVSPPAEPTIALEWGEPPASTTGRKPLGARLAEAGVLDQLKDKPNAWAQLVTWPSKSSAGGAATALRKKAPAEGRWEWRAVSRGTTSALWGRYLGK